MKTAILGATGLVGRAMLGLLESRTWVDEAPLVLTGERSAGSELRFRGGTLVCRNAAGSDFAGVRLALFSAGAAASRLYAPRAVAAGAWVIDNSSAFRMDPAVPLVVPEVNPQALPAVVVGDGRGARDETSGGTCGGIIANPNCSTIQIAVALAPLERAFGLREAHVTTLQAVSGAGRRAVDTLTAELAGYPERQAALRAGRLASGTAADGGRSREVGGVFPRPIAFNAVPQIGAPLPDGSFEEEAKVVRELRKILARPDLAVSCTATRVAVWNGHSAAVRVVLARAVTAAEAREAMQGWPGLAVAAAPHEFRTPEEISGDGSVHVGRLRQDPDRTDALLFWVVADNVLKGAALNAVQIADRLVGAELPA